MRLLSEAFSTSEMRFKLLLLLVFSISVCAEGTHDRVHQAATFKLKCESLAFRTWTEGSTCFFALAFPRTFDEATPRCDYILKGAAMDTKSRSILEKMMLDPHNYHSDLTMTQSKHVLCRYEYPIRCDAQEQDSLSGKCFRKMEPDTFGKGKKACHKHKSATLPVVDNDQDNQYLSSLLSNEERAWLDQSSSRGRWSVGGTKDIRFFSWFFDNSGIECSRDLAVTVSGSKRGSCVKYSKWEPSGLDDKRAVICMRDADSDFTPWKPIKEDPEPETTRAPSELEKTTTKKRRKTTTTRKPEVTEEPEEPEGEDPDDIDSKHLINVNCYFNQDKEVHAYCADKQCVDAIMSNGIGYSNERGITFMGTAIKQDSIAAVRKICPHGSKFFRNLAFELQGERYVHNLNGQGLKQGWVSTRSGACGSNLAIKRWTSKLSDDLKYGSDMEWNMWYQGRVQDGGAAQFYMWKKSERPLPEHLWLVSCHFNYAEELHAYCSTENNACMRAIQNNGIGNYATNRGVTPLGQAIRIDSIDAAKKRCPLGVSGVPPQVGIKHHKLPPSAPDLRMLSFELQGNKYFHNFEGIGIKQGYVSIVPNSCGATKAIRRWTSKKIPEDLKYGEDMEWNVWYKGRVQDTYKNDQGYKHFYMW